MWSFVRELDKNESEEKKFALGSIFCAIQTKPTQQMALFFEVMSELLKGEIFGFHFQHPRGGYALFCEL